MFKTVKELKSELQKYQDNVIQLDKLQQQSIGICNYLVMKIKDYEQKKPEETEKENEAAGTTDDK